MKFRSVAFNDQSWRSLLPASVYSAIHAWRFKGANRLRALFSLQPRDVELLVSSFVCAFTRPDSLFLDVGAQHGRHVRALLKNGEATAVAVAFEANPTLAARFAENFRDVIASQRLRIIHAAVADQPGNTEFFVNTFDSGYSGLVRRDITETKASYTPFMVIRTTIDEFCKTEAKPVSCIKIDVEGAEFAVLRGAEKTLAASRPVILFECASNAATFYGYGLADLVAWLEERRFFTFTITGQRVFKEMTQLMFDSRTCVDFIACPEERTREIAGQVGFHTHAE